MVIKTAADEMRQEPACRDHAHPEEQPGEPGFVPLS